MIVAPGTALSAAALNVAESALLTAFSSLRTGAGPPGLKFLGAALLELDDALGVVVAALAALESATAPPATVHAAKTLAVPMIARFRRVFFLSFIAKLPTSRSITVMLTTTTLGRQPLCAVPIACDRRAKSL
jgi:hypothetical protein